MSGSFPTTIYFNQFDTAGAAASVLGTEWEIYDSVGNGGFGFRKPAQAAVVTEATSTSGGKVLRLTAANVGGQLWSAGLKLKVPRTYGQYELRVRCSADASNVTSGVVLLWPQSNVWPRDSEVDWWETFNNRTTRTPVQSYVHRANPTTGADETVVSYNHTGVSQAAWHKIVCNWAPDELSISIDDGPFTLLTNDASWIPDWNMELCVQLDAWSNTPPSTPVTMDVDYVLIRNYVPITAAPTGLPRLGFNTPTTVATAVGPGDSTIPITPNTAMPTTGIYPVSLSVAGEQVTVAGATVSGSNLNLTGVTRAVNGVVRSHAVGDKVLMANPFRMSMGKAIGHTGRVIPPVTSNYTNTTGLVVDVLQPGGQVLAWMPCNPAGATTKRDPNWELGQFSSFVNADGSPSYGFWYPNTATGGTPYANANYNMVASVGQAFSGTGYLQTILNQTYLQHYAAQAWRTELQSGADMTPTNMHTFYLSARVRFHELITYDNSYDTGSGIIYGFTNHIQIYRTHPSSAVFVSMAAGKNLASDSVMRWHVNLDNRVYFDIPRTSNPVIPLNQWIHIEMYLVISDGFDGRTGRLKIWQDGVQFVDYTGPTIADYWERIGVSWGNYGQLLGQTTVTIDYDECLLSTAPTVGRLILPQAAGGLG